MKISLRLIRRDGGTQPRASISQKMVDEYAIDMQHGAIFPNVTLFYDGTAYWLADGFHRTAATEKLGWDEIESDIMQGTREDAQWFSCGANKEHDTSALRRTNAEKQASLKKALSLAKSDSLSNRAIAEHCGVSEFMVRDHRKPICDLIADSAPTIGISDKREETLVHPASSATQPKQIEVRRGTSTYTMKAPSAPRVTPRDKLASQIGERTSRAIDSCETLSEWAQFALDNRRRMETEDSPSFRINMMDRLKMLLKEDDAEGEEIIAEQETPEPDTKPSRPERSAWEQNQITEKARKTRTQNQMEHLSTLFQGDH